MHLSHNRRIGLFIDGTFFCKVSDYYEHHDRRQSRLSVRGLQQFIVSQVARWEEVSERDCDLIESHYFRGRFSVAPGTSRSRLERAARLEDELVSANVAPHFLPMGIDDTEKGVDVSLAVTALDAALTRHLDVIALIAGDGDFVPLLRQLKLHCKRILLLSWNLVYQDAEGRRRTTFTAKPLTEGATYALAMDRLIASAVGQPNAAVNRIFAAPVPLRAVSNAAPAVQQPAASEPHVMSKAG